MQGKVWVLKHHISSLEENHVAIATTSKELDTDIGVINEDLDVLENIVENLDNAQRKNNIKIRGLREATEGNYLVGYLTSLYINWVKIACVIVISITTAFWVGVDKASQRYPWDILVKFSSGDTKTKVLSAFQKNLDTVTEGDKISIYLDLSPLTLKKRHNFRFLTAKDILPLGFPFQTYIMFKTYFFCTIGNAICFQNKMKLLLASEET